MLPQYCHHAVCEGVHQAAADLPDVELLIQKLQRIEHESRRDVLGTILVCGDAQELRELCLHILFRDLEIV